MRSGRLTRALGAVLVVLAIVAIAWLVLASPLFHISAMEIDGNRRLSDGEIRAMTGTRIGASLVFLSTGEVERALEASPWIADAAVERRLPDTLLVRVTERRAVAFARDETSTVIVGDDGVVLGAVDEPPRLPSVGRYTDLEPGELLPGRLAAVRALSSLPRDVLVRIDEASVLGEDEPQVVFRVDGSPVELGAPSGLRAKALALAGVLAWADDRGVAFRYIDVSVPDAPVLRPRGRGRGDLTPPIDTVP